MSVPSDLPRERFLLCSFHSLSQFETNKSLEVIRFVSKKYVQARESISETSPRVTTGGNRGRYRELSGVKRELLQTNR